MSENEENMVDGIRVCLICGELVENPTPRQIEWFGEPKCCEGFLMVPLERNKIFQVVKGLEVLKAKLEAEIVKGIA